MATRVFSDDAWSPAARGGAAGSRAVVPDDYGAIGAGGRDAAGTAGSAGQCGDRPHGGGVAGQGLAGEPLCRGRPGGADPGGPAARPTV